MNTLPERSRQHLGKILGLLESEHAGERDAAVRAATRILDAHGVRWCEVLSLAHPPTRETTQSTPWRMTCQRLMLHKDDLSVWEVRFVSGLPSFRILSVKQRTILDEIAVRVLGDGEA
jgi:hypothetical protein